MNFSFSGLERAIECPSSLVLPQAQKWSEYAGHGTIIHNFLERVRAVGAEKALAFVPEDHRAACEILDLENEALALDPDAYAAEVSFAYDYLAGTARELGRGAGRDYSTLTATEVPGTSDLVGVSEDYVVILDYKTGFKDLGPLWQNWQLRGYALAAARCYGKKRALIIIVRIKPDGEAWQSKPELLTEMDLELVDAEIRALVDKHAAARNVYLLDGASALATSEGPWCQYCPAFDSCPSKMGLARALVVNGWELVEPMTDIEAAVAFERLESIESIAERVRSVLEQRAKRQPIPLRNGHVFAPKKRSTRTVLIALEAARRFLFEELGADVERHIEQNISAKALRSAVSATIRGRKGPDGRRIPLYRAYDELMARLEERGFVRVSHTYPVMKHKPKLELTAEGLSLEENNAEQAEAAQAAEESSGSDV